MFTGIVEETGRVTRIERTAAGADGAVGARITVDVGALDTSDVKLGDSIAVDGCCLTVVDMRGRALAFDLGPETLAVTTLGGYVEGTRVHLERAVRLADRLGGHLVQGHVDAVGRVVRADKLGDALLVRVEAPQSVTRLCIHKGSITVDGVSLTVNHVDDQGFEVGLIPHTLEKTHLGDVAAGTRVNLEADLIGKYIDKLMQR